MRYRGCDSGGLALWQDCEGEKAKWEERASLITKDLNKSGESLLPVDNHSRGY